MSLLTEKTISTQNTFTDRVKIQSSYFSLSIQGLTDSTVTVQKSYDTGTPTNWVDVDTFTIASEEIGFDPENVYYRAGIKTGHYGTDTVTIRFGGSDLSWMT